MPAKTQETSDNHPEEGEVDKLIDYQTGLDYWKSIPATIDGVLGGYGDQTIVPKRDISGSLIFLKKLASRMKPGPNEFKYGIEFGAGIGRLTKNLLYKFCDRVDLLEYNESYTNQMKVELKDLITDNKIGDIFTESMQNFPNIKPTDRKYWLIWIQWCIGYLNDELVINFLKYLKNNCLTENGTIILKENMCVLHDVEFDNEDSSVTRSDLKFKELFKKSGLKLIAQDIQKGLPKELYPVKMYALKKDPNSKEE